MSKIISKDRLERIDGGFERQESDMNAMPKSTAMSSVGMITASQIEAIQREAYEEAYQKGYREGLQTGQKEIQTKVAQMQHILQFLTKPMATLDNQVEQELLKLLVVMFKHLVRREIKMEPGHIIAVVREAIAQLPVASRNIRVYLHPDDAATVKEMLRLAKEDTLWQIIEDPVLSVGGCKLATDTSQVDATLDSRLNAVVANLLGDERQAE